MGKVVKMPLYRFFHQVFEEIKKKQDDIKRRKTEFLYKEAYRYYLDLYLMRIANEQIIDLPPFMYETGRVICEEAKRNAEKAMLDVIMADRIEYCYTKRIKDIKKLTVKIR